MHGCGDPSMLDYEEKKYSVTQLFTHLINDCMEKLRICPMCNLTLETPAANEAHIQSTCSLVQIGCDTCHKSFTRAKFREHICYTKYKNYREVIELKHDQNLKLEEKNKDLKNQIQ